VPYAAVMRFYDPSVQFLLQFEAPAAAAPAAEAKPAEPAPEASATETDQAAKIVSLDQFRKK